jgi:hypothetical protein
MYTRDESSSAEDSNSVGMVIDAPGMPPQVEGEERPQGSSSLSSSTMQQGIDWASSECFLPAASYACLQNR